MGQGFRDFFPSLREVRLLLDTMPLGGLTSRMSSFFFLLHIIILHLLIHMLANYVVLPIASICCTHANTHSTPQLYDLEEGDGRRRGDQWYGGVGNIYSW
jgi:hypothetical protein